jgi:Flp pilus assembly secretin CpaC
MSSRVASLCFFLGAACASPFADHARAAEEHIVKVEVDYARLVRMPEGAQTLVVGNPLIADITMLKNSRLMVVTGKSFGTTNLIILDRTGQQVGESLITVVPPEDKLVVYRGSHRESLSCKPRCARAVDMADDNQYMNNTIESVRSHDNAVSSLRK